jgi:hypothetical protein
VTYIETQGIHTNPPDIPSRGQNTRTGIDDLLWNDGVPDLKKYIIKPASQSYFTGFSG